jgi:hypothetical protein
LYLNPRPLHIPFSLMLALCLTPIAEDCFRRASVVEAPTQSAHLSSSTVPRLSDKGIAQRIDATNVPSEIAVSISCSALPDAIRAAEVLFFIAPWAVNLYPATPARRRSMPVDADWLEMLARAKRARPLPPGPPETVRHAQAAQRQGGASPMNDEAKY